MKYTYTPIDAAVFFRRFLTPLLLSLILASDERLWILSPICYSVVSACSVLPLYVLLIRGYQY